MCTKSVVTGANRCTHKSGLTPILVSVYTAKLKPNSAHQVKQGEGISLLNSLKLSYLPIYTADLNGRNVTFFTLIISGEMENLRTAKKPGVHTTLVKVTVTWFFLPITPLLF
jgi:hypothetical protein